MPALADADIASLEQATLDAVAPAHIDALQDWLLPMDRSTIGRAKSAVPLRHHALDTRALGHIESRYRAWGIGAAFRVAEVAGLANVHAALRAMGYLPDQATVVQVGLVSGLVSLGAAAPADIDLAPTERWSSVYTAPGFDPVDGAHRVAALSRSHCVVYASKHQSGAPVAAGTGAMSQGWASIHGMRTVPQARRQGWAAQILASLGALAAQRGYTRAFLQVEAGNAPALALYQRAGFTTAWTYHYWRKPAQT